jgi:hypothetical protein
MVYLQLDKSVYDKELVKQNLLEEAVVQLVDERRYEN